MSAPASIRCELAAALRRLNADYYRLPADQRPEVGWNEVDEHLEAALTSGDHQRAMDAIEDWRDRHLALIEEARIAQGVAP